MLTLHSGRKKKSRTWFWVRWEQRQPGRKENGWRRRRSQRDGASCVKWINVRRSFIVCLSLPKCHVQITEAPSLPPWARKWDYRPLWRAAYVCVWAPVKQNHIEPIGGKAQVWWLTCRDRISSDADATKCVGSVGICVSFLLTKQMKQVLTNLWRLWTKTNFIITKIFSLFVC